MRSGQEGTVALRAREEGRVVSSDYAHSPLSSYQGGMGVAQGMVALTPVPPGYGYACIETHLCTGMNTHTEVYAYISYLPFRSSTDHGFFSA